MALVTKEIVLDLTPGFSPQVVCVSEYDIDRQFNISFTNEGAVFTIPSGTTAKIEGTIGEYGFSKNCTVNENKVSFKLSSDMTAIRGRVWVKIKLTSSNGDFISTGAFWLEVERAGIEAGTITGASGFEELIAEAAIQALTDTGNELFKDSFTYRGALASTDDLNDALAPGYYWIPAGGIGHGVNANNARVLVFNRKDSLTARVQVWFDIPNNRMHTRTGRGSDNSIVWSDWAASGDSAALTYRPNLTASDNMNTLMKPGYYYKANGVEVANGVNSSPARILVLNQETAAIGLVQIWIDTAENTMYLRTARAPAQGYDWSSWAPGGMEGAMVYRGKLVNGDSVDDASLPGTYFKDAGISVEGGVNSDGARIVTFTKSSGLYALSQLWIDVKANTIYLRTTRNLEKYGWGDFAQLATVDQVAAMVSGAASTASSVKTFLQLENAKAESLNAADTVVTIPSGNKRTTLSTARNLARIAAAADANDILSGIWGQDTYTITTKNDSPRTIKINTTVSSSALEQYYTLIGGKTGHLDGSGDKEEICNLMAVCQKNGIKVAGAIMGATSEAARFTAMKELMDCAFDKIESGSSTTELKVTSAKYAAAIRLDTNTIIYSKYADEVYPTASAIKTLTVLTALDYIDDLSDVYTIDAEDLERGSGYVFNTGDKVTIEDLIYAAMLPSSNTAAKALAHYVGSKIIGASRLKITQQPIPVDAPVGWTAYFQVAAQGVGVLSYQWYYFDTTSNQWSITTREGNETNRLIIPVTAARDGIQWKCRVKDSAGNIAWSDPTFLTVRNIN